jgi:LysM repeat protein
MLTPVLLAGQGQVVPAFLQIVQPRVPDSIIPFRFNPTEYRLSKSNNFAEIPIPGLQAPPIQFIRGSAERLSTELLLDTSDILLDVRLVYVNRLRALLDIDSSLHAPPIVRFVWSTQEFLGVLESLDATYVMFSPEGIPLRAKLSITLKEYRPVEVQVKEKPKQSPDVDKAYTVRRGDTLSGIAETAYKDAGQWRLIAAANGIQDPRALSPGLVLTLPRRA